MGICQIFSFSLLNGSNIISFDTSLASLFQINYLGADSLCINEFFDIVQYLPTPELTPELVNCYNFHHAWLFFIFILLL